MDSSCHSLSWNVSEIKYQIPNLAVEDIRSAILESIGPVWITINQSESLETGCGLENRKIIWIPNYLSVIVVNDRGGNHICT